MTKDQVRRVVGYVRVSTGEQQDSGAGMEAQRSAIRAKAAERGWELVEILEDTASGKSFNRRPELQRALAMLQARKAEGLVVAKLDRLSRSVPDFGRVLEQASRQDWALVALDFDIDTSTPGGELVANVLMSVAQWERKAIGQRTREALAVRKAQGVRLGKPRMIPPEIERRILGLRADGRSYPAIARELTAAGVPTSTGTPAWSWSTVRRVVARQ